MKKSSYLRLRALVLRRLVYENCYGQKQILLENVAKFLKEEKHQAEQVLKKLIAQGLVLSKKKHYGTHVWLNSERLEEIRQMVSEEG